MLICSTIGIHEYTGAYFNERCHKRAHTQYRVET